MALDGHHSRNRLVVQSRPRSSSDTARRTIEVRSGRPPIDHVCDSACPNVADEDWRALAEHHARSHWSPVTAETIIGDHQLLGQLMTNIRRQARQVERRAAAAPLPRVPAFHAGNVDVPPGGFYLYRLWTEHDRLLYVGVSITLAKRLACHRRTWPDLWVRATWEEHPDARSMLAAEQVAIRTENPALNQAGVS